MSFTIAVAGKGGTGKTTLAALVIRYLVENRKKPVFAVDADANVNLNEALGVGVEATIGSLREELLADIGSGSIPAGMPKEAYVELQLQEALVEGKDFDLLVMGRPEGPGCYCYANNLLRKFVDILAKNYPYIVIDNEAGMEHLSRRTTQDVDVMLIVTDPSPVGVLTAGRIRDLAAELGLNVGETGCVVNRVAGGSSGLPHLISEHIAERGLNLAGVLPSDEMILDFAFKGKSLLELPEESLVVKAVDEMMRRWIT